MKRAVTILCLLTGLWASVGAGAQALGAGDHEIHLVHAGLERKALVHVPASYSASRPMPLVLSFHGGGGDMQHQADDSRYGQITASEQHGFIAVFPNGVGPLRSGKLATWNAGRCCARARDQNVDDVGFVRALVARLGSDLNIDARRIFATGMSNGGMLAYRLACEAADLVRAVAAVAGTDNTVRCSPQRAIAVLHIHARNDDHVLFDGGAGQGLGARDPSRITDFTSVPATISRWVERNACAGTAQRVLERPGAYCERHASCRGGVEVELCVTESGGHSWPGAQKTRGEPSSKALSANDVMWDFFMRQPLD